MLRVKFDRVRFAIVSAICVLSGAALAQDMPAAVFAPPDVAPQLAAAAPPPAATAEPASAPAEAAPAPGPATPAANPLNKGQLEQLVAPIALYPDPLLSEVLMASTYPLEIVEADRWVREPGHQALKGDALTNALKDQHWDPSVMALVPFPKLLALMAEKLQWTQQLGNAFLGQQKDVMAAVQALRHDAMQAGNLKATPQCHCVVQTSGDTISIMPSDSKLVCVPLYNPRVVYGSWREPDYPPDYFPIPVGFYFEPGYPIGFWPFVELADYGPLWGWWSIDWGGYGIVVDRVRFAALGGGLVFGGNTWVHDPAHRGGVAYADRAVTTRFGAARVAAVTAAGRTSAGRGPGGGLSAPAGAASGRAGFAGRTSAAHFGATAGAGFAGRATTSHFSSPTRGGGHFAASRAGVAASGGAAHFGHAGFSGGRMGGAAHMGGGARFGGGGPAMAHASFGAVHMGGGAPRGGGGGPHGGGGGPHGGGGGGHGGGRH